MLFYHQIYNHGIVRLSEIAFSNLAELKGNFSSYLFYYIVHRVFSVFSFVLLSIDKANQTLDMVFDQIPKLLEVC